MTRNFSPAVLWFAATACAAACSATAARAQSDETAYQTVRVQAFGMASYVRPDFGGALKNAGGAVGGDIDFSLPVQNLELGAEFRVIGSGGRVSNQYTYSFGPRLLYNAGRYHPYVDFLYGKGTIKFNDSKDPTYTQDSAAVPTFGGGLDYDLSPQWAIRGDVQRQSWNLGTRSPLFHPLQISVGVRYQFHFASKHGPH